MAGRFGWIAVWFVVGWCVMDMEAASAGRLAAAEKEVPVVFSGGHEIGRNDFGRPVVLIAAALNVKPEIFREAFSGVTPAKGKGPTGEEARRLLSASAWTMADYQRVIARDRNYAKPAWTAALTWPEVEKKPLLELQAETLKQHPELAPAAPK